MLMARRGSEALVLKRVSSGSGRADDSDLARATRIAFDMERTLGFGAEHPLLYRPHREPGAVLDREPERAARVHGRLEAALDRAAAILRRRRSTFHALAKALFDAEAMDEAAVLQILTGGDLTQRSCDETKTFILVGRSGELFPLCALKHEPASREGVRGEVSVII
jgi:cell division protease FtsH